MTDATNTTGPITKRDLYDGNADKVFRDGFAADRAVERPAERPDAEVASLIALLDSGAELTPEARAQIAHAIEHGAMSSRLLPMPAAQPPSFTISQSEMDAIKVMSMAGPAIPQWLRGNIGGCWSVVQMSRHLIKFDHRQQRWIYFDPFMVGRASYLVTSRDNPEGTVAFMSIFIRAALETFAPLTKRLRYEYAGEGQDRTCTCIGWLRGETEPHVYTTPALKLITPKQSPLWASNPDVQLAYNASKFWGRLHCAAVLMGIVDEDEIEGQRVGLTGPAAQAVTASLQDRIAAARENGAPRAGFRPDVVETAQVTPETTAPEPNRAAKGTRKAAAPQPPTPAKEKRAPARRRAAAPPPPTEEPHDPETGEVVEPATPTPTAAAPAKAPAAPKNYRQYREHVRAWLMLCATEEQINERWRTEMKLRNQCGVTSEEKESIHASYVLPRVSELRGG